MTRVAVVGHVEWAEFVRVPHFPPRGSVTHARDAFTRAAGGGGVAAVAMAELGSEAHFFTALGRDHDGKTAAAEIEGRGVNIHVAWRDQPTRRVITLLEPEGQRTIMTVGERLEPLGADDLAWDILEGADGVYFTAGDAEALRLSRRARVLTSTPRAREALEHSGEMVDALIFSDEDHDETSWSERLHAHARFMVATEGANGGRWWGESEGRWPIVSLPGPAQDSYGCGDSFAAGMTVGLAQDLSMLDAARIGAERGALALTRVGAP